MVDYFRYLKSRLTRIRHGYRLGDKLRLLLYALIYCTPRRVRKRISSIDEIVRKIEDMITNRTMLSVFGLKYNLLDSESVNVIDPSFEKWMWNLLKPKEGDVFVDVGAHVGKYTCAVARMVGEKGVVVAVEPSPANYITLLKNIQSNNLRNVKVFRVAAYDKDCKLQLFRGNTAGHNSVKKDMGLGSIEVSAKKLDSILLGDFKRVDWVKIDVEHAEYEVLKGMTRTLTRFRPKLIVETWQENMGSVVDLLRSLRYWVTLVEGLESPLYLSAEPEKSRR